MLRLDNVAVVTGMLIIIKELHSVMKGSRRNLGKPDLYLSAK